MRYDSIASTWAIRVQKTKNIRIMKKLVLLTVGVLFFQISNGQTYYPFPTDTSQWNCLTWAQWSAVDMFLINTQYRIQGDTNIGEQSYNKVYYHHTDNPTPYSEYIGGIREDSLKNIFFYPYSINLPTYTPTTFPNDTSETLIYMFHNLDSGMILPINTGVTEIKVVGIDSVLIGNNYRKRYKIEQENYGNDYWIEGIGSVKDLFMPFTYEFEETLYTLCFTDSVTYYINSPNGEDSCHYALPLGVKEIVSEKISIYPNPASQTIEIKSLIENDKGIINIYNNQGNKILTGKLIDSKSRIDISQIKSGFFIVEIITKNGKDFVKFIKK